MFTHQIRFAASNANSMVIMKINVKNTLYVQNAANRLYTMKRYVKTQPSLSNVEKATLLTVKCKVWLKEKEILRVKFTGNISFPEARRGWSGGAMVLGKLPVPGRPTI